MFKLNNSCSRCMSILNKIVNFWRMIVHSKQIVEKWTIVDKKLTIIVQIEQFLFHICPNWTILVPYMSILNKNYSFLNIFRVCYALGRVSRSHVLMFVTSNTVTSQTQVYSLFWEMTWTMNTIELYETNKKSRETYEFTMR